MKHLTLLLAMFLAYALTFAQQPTYRIKANNTVLTAGNDTANLTITGGDLTLTKYDIDESGQVLLVIDKQTGKADTLSISDVQIDGGGIDTVYQSGDTTYIISGDNTYISVNSNIDDQSISISNDTIYLEDGGFVVLPTDEVDDADADPANELQFLGLGDRTDSTQIIALSSGGVVSVDFRDADADPENELQTLGLTMSADFITGLVYTQISISDGNSIWWANIPSVADTLNQYQNLVQLNDSSFLITETNDTIVITSSYVNSVLSETNQEISISNDTIYLENGGFVVLPSGGSSEWENPVGDTIEPVNKDAVMSIFDLFGEGEFEYISPQGFKLTNKPTIVAGQEFETFKIEFNDTSSGRTYALCIQRYPAAFDPTRPYEVSLGSTNFTTFEADVVSISEKNGIKLVRNSSGNTPISHIILGPDSTVSIFADSIQLNNEGAASNKVLRSLDGDGWIEWSNTFITTSDTASLSTPIEGHIIYCTDCTNDDATTGSVMVGNGTIWRKIKYQ